MPEAGSADSRMQNLSPAKRELLAQRLRGQQDRGALGPTIPRRTEAGAPPLSLAQERLWYIDQLMPGTPLYGIPLILRLQGDLRVDALEAALARLVHRHESLRTTFRLQGGEPVQVVSPPGGIVLPSEDLSALPEGEREAVLDRRLREGVNAVFDLAAGPLFAVRHYRLGPRDHVVAFQFHHTVFDGWSSHVFLRELSSLYREAAGGPPATLPELPIRYTDFSVWQRREAAGEAGARMLAYWTERLKGELPVQAFPAERSRPATRTHHGGQVHLRIPGETPAALFALATKAGATPFMAMLAAYTALLHRYSGEDDVVVGCPFAGRTHPELEGLIGFFVNTLALRTRPTSEMSYLDVLERVRDAVMEGFSNQDVPFQSIVRAVAPERGASLTPIFQTLFTYDDSTSAVRDLGGLPFRILNVPADAAMTDLLVTTEWDGSGMTACAIYSADLFDGPDAARVLDHFRRVLEGAVRDPRGPIGDLPLLGEAERRRVLVEWNRTRTEYPRDAMVHELFERQAALSPDAIALTVVPAGGADAVGVTYAELDARAARLAHRLRALGVGPDAMAGLFAERSADAVAAILAILKTGGAYVPLDPAYPRERLAFMMEDTALRVVLTTRAQSARLPAFAGTVLVLDSGEDGTAAGDAAQPAGGLPADPGRLAYVMYTSGSTGKPKGVAIPHRGIVRLVRNTDYAEFGPDTVMLLFAPLSFDASTLEIWGPLLNGGRVVVAPPGALSPADLGQVIRRHAVNTLWLSAELFRLMVDERLDDLRGVRQLLAGGDVLPVAQVRKVLEGLPGCRLINGYGPTENTTFTCCAQVWRDRRTEPSVPIGRPIANTTAYILDRRRQPVPIGIAGELYTGGDGLARGYVNRPDLTADRFVTSPHVGDGLERLYRTGDLCRHLSDGSIEFLGRMDRQVKVRGFRIEPGEIESALGAHPAVAQAAVVVWSVKPGDQRLAAYFVLRSGAVVTATDLRRHLRQSLPEYMVPQHFVELPELPLSPTGKIERRALPSPFASGVSAGDGGEPPRRGEEARVADIWKELLGVGSVRRQDNFFDLGGHSLLAMRAVARISEALGVQIRPNQLLFGSLEQVAAACRRAPDGPVR